MKRLVLAVCVLSIAYAGYSRFFVKKGEMQAEQAAAEQATGPTYVAMEPGGPVYRISTETRAQVDKFSAEKVVMFGATWCGYCASNRKIFAERGVQYVEIDIDRDPAALAFMQKTLGSPGVPTTVLGTRLIPGFSAQELESAIKRL
jgi:glutaredoxin